MRHVLIFFVVFALLSCQTKVKQLANKADFDPMALIDSISQLNPDDLSKNILTLSDSVFYNQKQFQHTIDQKTFENLKKTFISGKLTIAQAEQLFPDFPKDSIKMFDDNQFEIELHTFNENQWDEFAISFSDNSFWISYIYFFQQNKIIGKHTVFHKYGLEMNHFKDENNKTVVYYWCNFMNGTGIWWNQNQFYRYDDQQLTPVLSELQNINLQTSWSLRSFWIDAYVVNTKPLQIKYIYDSQFEQETDEPKDFINDSTIVTYHLNDKGIYQGDFSNSKLNYKQLLSFYLTDNNLLFVNAYANELRTILNGNDEIQKESLLRFLQDLREQIFLDEGSYEL